MFEKDIFLVGSFLDAMPGKKVSVQDKVRPDEGDEVDAEKDSEGYVDFGHSVVPVSALNVT